MIVPATTTTSTTTTTLPYIVGTFTLQPGWNLISLPYSHIFDVQQDDCELQNGNFYFYNAIIGKWNVQTVGVANLQKATSYWFYSPGQCIEVLRLSIDSPVHTDDITLSKNDWSEVGAPVGGMTLSELAAAKCWNCAGGVCASQQVQYYDALARQFRTASSLDEYVGYMVQCLG